MYLVLTEPPYEVSETGWGEFDAKIEMHFHDPMEAPIEVHHLLRLYLLPNVNTPPTKKVYTKETNIFNKKKDIILNIACFI